MTIKVFLHRDVADLGRAGQVVTVTQAYARNFLIPQGLAAVATPALVARAEQVAATATATKEQVASAAHAAAAKLAGQTIHLSVRANPQGKLFAALKSEQVVTAILAQTHLRLPPNAKLEPSQLKALGDHPVQLRLAGQTIDFIVHLDHGNA